MFEGITFSAHIHPFTIISVQFKQKRSHACDVHKTYIITFTFICTRITVGHCVCVCVYDSSDVDSAI